MLNYGRLSVAAVLGCAWLAASAAPAAAQFVGGVVNPSFRPVQPVPFLPSIGGYNPLGFQYYSTQQFSIPSPLGTGQSLNYSRSYYGYAGLALQRRYNQPPAYSTLYAPASSGYMTGGAANNAANRDFAAAQKAAANGYVAPAAAKTAIYDQWAYEKLGVTGLPALKPGHDAPDALLKAMATTDERELATGDALNHVLVATVAAENKGAKHESPFLAPNLVAEVRFAGSPAADAANLLRRAGRLDLPAAFDRPGLADLRPALDRDFAAAAAPVLAGKAADVTKVAALEATVKKARDALAPLVPDLEFADATAARRLLNQLDATAKVLRGPAGAGLLDPRWPAEGANVSDLVRHMTKHKLLFGPADRGDEEVYVALHRGLVAYLAVLKESPKELPKK